MASLTPALWTDGYTPSLQEWKDAFAAATTTVDGTLVQTYSNAARDAAVALAQTYTNTARDAAVATAQTYSNTARDAAVATAQTYADAAKVAKAGDTMTGPLSQVTSGLVTAHNTVQTGTGTASYAAFGQWPHAGFAYNYKLITSDQVQLATDQFTAGRQVVMGDVIDVVTGGAAANGARIAHGAFLRVLTSPTSGANGSDFMGGSWTFAQSVVPVIGSTAGVPRGNLYGINPQVQLYTGATNYVSIMAQENDVEVDVGASVQYKWGITISTVGDDAVHGSVGEAALHIGAVPTASAGWLTGIMFSDFNGGGMPVHASGTLIRGNKFGGGGFIPVTHGVDLTAFSFSGYAYRSPSFSVDGSGNLAAANAVFSGGASALSGFNVGASGNPQVLTVFGVAAMKSTLGVVGAASFASTLGVTGATTLAGVTASGPATFASNVGIAGATALAGFTATGPASLASTLNVTGVVQTASDVQVGHDLGVTHNLTIGGRTTITVGSYASDAAAGAAGLTLGAVYLNSTIGALTIKT